jgi:hypothetical protein
MDRATSMKSAEFRAMRCGFSGISHGFCVDLPMRVVDVPVFQRLGFFCGFSCAPLLGMEFANGTDMPKRCLNGWRRCSSGCESLFHFQRGV